jgi:hypothetical protein
MSEFYCESCGKMVGEVELEELCVGYMHLKPCRICNTFVNTIKEKCYVYRSGALLRYIKQLQKKAKK